MSSSDPEPSDVPSPPKPQRPKLNRLTKGSSEKDLWDFDADAVEETPAIEEAPTDTASAIVPKPRTKAPRSVERTPRPLPASHHGDEPTERKSAVGSRGNRIPDPVRRSKPTDDIGELEASEESWAEPDLSTHAAVSQEPPTVVEKPKVPPVTEAAVPSETSKEEPVPGDQPSSETVVPIDHRPIRERLGLTKVEKLCLGVLTAALIGTAIFLLTTTFGRMPTRSDSAEKPNFPIKGSLVRILDAGSYWREPVKSGTAAESVRRETKLIPVLTLELEGGPCAIRAFFRNDKGEFVGDGVTRSAVSGKIEIPATAGFDDIGAHSAYRTGEIHPWKIEIFEAPSVDSSRQEFKKLLELSISSDRR